MERGFDEAKPAWKWARSTATRTGKTLYIFRVDPYHHGGKRYVVTDHYMSGKVEKAIISPRSGKRRSPGGSI